MTDVSELYIYIYTHTHTHTKYISYWMDLKSKLSLIIKNGKSKSPQTKIYFIEFQKTMIYILNFFHFL